MGLRVAASLQGIRTSSPRRRCSTDLATRYVKGPTQLAVYFYNYRIDDLVERYQTQTDFFFFRNRGRARLRGFEFEARTALPWDVAVEVGTNIGRGVALDDDANLDDISPDTFSLLLRKDFAGRAFAQMRTAFLAKDERPSPSEVAAPGATLIDLAGGFRFVKYLELRANARNLLNDAYYASPDPRWVYAPGRSASVTLAFQF